MTSKLKHTFDDSNPHYIVCCQLATVVILLSENYALSRLNDGRHLRYRADWNKARAGWACRQPYKGILPAGSDSSNLMPGHLLQKSDIANIVGNRIIKQAIEMKLAKELSIRKIGGVPFLMIYKFQHR